MLEEESDHAATAARLREYSDALMDGRLDEVPRVQAIICGFFASVRDKLQEFQAKPAQGPQTARSRKWLQAIPADVLAVVILRQVFANCIPHAGNSSPPTFQRVGVGIGRAIVSEVIVRQGFEVQAGYMQAAERRLRSTNTKATGHYKRTMTTAALKVLDATYQHEVSAADAMQIGKWGIRACTEVGLLEIVNSPRRRGVGNSNICKLSPDVLEWVYGTAAEGPVASLNNETSNMIAPPIPWNQIVGGGYYSQNRQALSPLIRITTLRARKSVVEEYRAGLEFEHMPEVYTAVNFLQDHAFTIHAPTLAVVTEVWRTGGGALGVPTRGGGAAPSFPFPEGWVKEEASTAELNRLDAWKRSMAQWYTADIRRRGQLAGVAATLRSCSRYVGKFWCPGRLDFRGRFYYRGALHPQGGDVVRGLLRLANTKPLGARGIYWIRVHIANCFGHDKIPIDDRAQWTIDNWQDLSGSLEAPGDSPVLSQAEAPVQAYAAIWELREALASPNPHEYQSGLPVFTDATCSGLQHFAAMLRDPETARLVNLLPGEERHCIYTEVAKRLQDKLSNRTDVLSQEWVKIGLDKQVCKTPVMTYVYGATVRGTSDDLLMMLDTLGWEHPVATRLDMASYLAPLIFQTVEEVAPAAAKMMRWLRELARNAPRDKPVQWRSPVGMLVNHDYMATKDVRVKVKSSGVSTTLVKELLDKTCTRRSINALPPNFVHSMDAAHLLKVANRMANDGLSMLAVHDSFGTHACDVDALLVHTKAAFAGLYHNKDVAGNLAKQIGADVASPEQGDLDVTQVLKSQYFFS